MLIQSRSVGVASRLAARRTTARAPTRRSLLAPIDVSVVHSWACASLLGSRRGIMGPAGPTQALVDAVGYPEGSISRHLLQRCMDEAVLRGIDVTQAYRPWLPVDVMQTLIINIHDAVGCSWMMAIVVACLGIRMVTLPVSVAAIRGAREKALIQPEFQRLTEQQKSLSQQGDQQKVQEVSKKLQAFTQTHGKFFMLKGSWNLLCFQMPLYITAFAAMRGFANYPDVFRGFAMETPLWLDSLALADPYAILPILTASLMLTNTELHGSIDTEVSQASPLVEAGGQPGTMQKYQKWVMRGSAFMFVPFTWNFPAGVFVFMSTNMLASSLQNRLLRLPTLERLLEIPPPAKEQEAANAAAQKGPPALMNLGATLRLPVGAVPAAPLAHRRDQRSPAALANDRRPQILLDSTAVASVVPAAARLVKTSIDILDVSKKFAVRKARPAQPV